MKIKSPAKINLHLQVINKRNDDYHEIRSVFQLIDLFDEISFEVTEKEIQLNQEPYEIKDNLIHKAALSLKEATNSSLGANISVKKMIPIGKGLGGGSSDAATTLIVLNKLWQTGLTKQELLEIGLGLGSDVPFFIHGKNCWAEGRGEIFKQISLQSKLFLLIFPEVNISTKEAFNNLEIEEKTPISKEKFLDGFSFNSFENWAKENFYEIENAFELLKDFGTPRLTGTGSAVFVPLKNQEEGKKALKNFEKGIIVKSLDDSPLRQLIE
tara:strand:- start:65 stop:871 length:807 start_codon:yes stop_codon:yes gene_type:complete